MSKTFRTTRYLMGARHTDLFYFICNIYTILIQNTSIPNPRTDFLWFTYFAFIHLLFRFSLFFDKNTFIDTQHPKSVRQHWFTLFSLRSVQCSNLINRRQHQHKVITNLAQTGWRRQRLPGVMVYKNRTTFNFW